MFTVMQQMYDFDAWATQRLLESMGQLSADEYSSVEASGQGSIQATFAHLISTQYGWFSWFSGRLPPLESMQVRIEAEEVASLEQAALRWAEVREQTERTLRGLSQEAVTNEWSVDLPNGQHVSLPLWKMLLHVANHGTHTRAQIMAAIRRCRHIPLGGDLIHMLLRR